MKKLVLKVLLVAIMIASMSMFGTMISFAADISSADDIKAAGDYKLAGDIAGNIDQGLTSGTYNIDLNGHIWTGYIKIQGATVNFTDSSSAKTGNITTDQNDVVMLESGKLTATGIKVTGNKSECDGIFVSGGEAVINDCTITAISSTVQNSGGKITINGGTYSSSNNALKVNKDSTITINGGKFEGDLFIGDKSTTNTTIDKAFLPGNGYKLVITEKSEDGTKVVKAEVVKEDVSVATPTPTKPGTSTPTKKPDTGKQPSTGDTTGIIALVFIALSALVVVKKKIEA